MPIPNVLYTSARLSFLLTFFSHIYEATGPIYIWLFNIFVISSNLILLIVFYERIVPSKLLDKIGSVTSVMVMDEDDQVKRKVTLSFE